MTARASRIAMTVLLVILDALLIFAVASMLSGCQIRHIEVKKPCPHHRRK